MSGFVSCVLRGKLIKLTMKKCLCSLSFTKIINKFITFLFFAFITNGKAQNNDFIIEKSLILKNQSESLVQLAKIASVIDSDTESYVAFKYSDSLLLSIDKSGKNFNLDLSKVYSAQSIIFYGMSYTKSIKAISRGDNYSLDELNKSIIQPSKSNIIDYYKLSKNELFSIYSIINFYKVSRMARYANMNKLFENDLLKLESAFKNYEKKSAYRIISFNNKKLFYKIFIGLIIDLHSINNPNIDDTTFNNYAQILVKLGEKMDKIPSDYHTIIKLSDKVYYNHIVNSSEVQKSLLNLLINEIKILKKSKE